MNAQSPQRLFHILCERLTVAVAPLVHRILRTEPVSGRIL